MATYTASVQIGKGHPYDGGIGHSYNQLDLSENSNIAWIANIRSRRYIWYPRSVDTVAEDGLLMAATLFLKHSAVGQSLASIHTEENCIRRQYFIRLDEHKDIDFDAAFKSLATEIQVAEAAKGGHMKLMVDYTQQSILANQLETIKALDCDIEIRTTSYLKEYSCWGQSQSIWPPEAGTNFDLDI